MKTILFVCTGNTCRSPMAEVIFNKYIKDNNIDNLKAESAGLAAEVGAPASDNAVAATKEIGCDLKNHKSRQLTAKMLDEAEKIYTMTSSQEELLKTYFPPIKEKISAMPKEVPDPFGGDLKTYEICRDSILCNIKIITEQVK